MGAARKLDDMSEVKIVGIDETSLRKGQNYIIVGTILKINVCSLPARDETTKPCWISQPTSKPMVVMIKVALMYDELASESNISALVG